MPGNLQTASGSQQKMTESNNVLLDPHQNIINQTERQSKGAGVHILLDTTADVSMATQGSNGAVRWRERESESIRDEKSHRI